jgi:group I intron endonuclease
MDGFNTEKQSMVSISIYRITNRVNGKVYVGQTRVPKRRWTDHQYAAKKNVDTYFYSAVRKYGASNFEYEIMEVCTLAQADDREMYWIRRLRATDKEYGYNTSIGGTNGNNSTSQEVRDKISRAKKGVSTGPCPPERAENIRRAKLASGYRHTEETKQKIKDNRNVVSLTPEWRKNISEGLLRSVRYILGNEDVIAIISMLTAGQTVASIAKQYGVSWRTIDRVRNGEYAAKQKGRQNG